MKMKWPRYHPKPWAEILATTALVLGIALWILWEGYGVGTPRTDCPGAEHGEGRAP